MAIWDAGKSRGPQTAALGKEGAGSPERDERLAGEDPLADEGEDWADDLDDAERDEAIAVETWRKRLRDALRDEDVEALEEALRDATPERINIPGGNPLADAALATNNGAQLAKLLIDAGCDANLDGKTGEWPLMIALKNQGESLPAILDATNCDKIMSDSMTPLMAAATRGEHEWVKLLLPRSDAEKRSGRGLDRQTAFELCVMSSLDESARLLAPASDMWKKQSLMGNITSAHWAIRRGLSGAAAAIADRLVEQDPKNASQAMSDIVQKEAGDVLSAVQIKEATGEAFGEAEAEKIKRTIESLAVWALGGHCSAAAEATLASACDALASRGLESAATRALLEHRALSAIAKGAPDSGAEPSAAEGTARESGQAKKPARRV